MNLESKHLFSDDDKLVNIPVNTYCAKCDLLMLKGKLMRRFDKATYYHDVCPNLPLRRYALKRLAEPGTYVYPMVVNMDRK